MQTCKHVGVRFHVPLLHFGWWGRRHSKGREQTLGQPVGEVRDLGGRAAGARSHVSSSGGAVGVEPERKKQETDKQGPLKTKTKKAPEG